MNKIFLNSRLKCQNQVKQQKFDRSLLTVDNWETRNSMLLSSLDSGDVK